MGGEGRRILPAVSAWVDRFGVPLCFAWGFAEATLFFVVPDVGVGLVALMRPRRAFPAAVAAVVGAVAGGVILYLAAQGAGSVVGDAVDGVPFIPQRMVVEAGGDLADHGGVAVVLGPLEGVPYKLYAVEMAARDWGVASFAAWTAVARSARIVPVGLVVGVLGWGLRRRVERRPLRFVAAYGLVWGAVYARYWASTGF